MRLSGIASLLTLTSIADAEALSAKAALLIPPDARCVIGFDLARYEQSKLATLYPFVLDSRLSEVIEQKGAGQLRHLVIIEGAPSSAEMLPLTILSGAAADFAPSKDNPSGAFDDGRFAIVDASTAIVGDPQSVREALDRWKADGEASELGAAVKRLSENYDNWFVVNRPLDSPEAMEIPVARLRYRRDLADVVEQVRGGVKAGGFDEFHLEAIMKTVDDASGLAALARWIPGFIQMHAPQGLESQLADLAENVVVSASGRTVSLSFQFDENKLDALIKAKNTPPVIPDPGKQP
jgi:hypothetical protein